MGTGNSQQLATINNQQNTANCRPCHVQWGAHSFPLVLRGKPRKRQAHRQGETHTQYTHTHTHTHTHSLTLTHTHTNTHTHRPMYQKYGWGVMGSLLGVV